MMQTYPGEIEVQMQRYYESLSEKDRRRYAAIEAVKLGYGGQAYIRRLRRMPSRNLTVRLAGTSVRNGAWAGADSPTRRWT